MQHTRFPLSTRPIRPDEDHLLALAIVRVNQPAAVPVTHWSFTTLERGAIAVQGFRLWYQRLALADMDLSGNIT